MNLEPLLSVAVGLGLSAACGFRVFVPLLFIGVASRTGHLDLAQGFQWMSQDTALIAFAVATVLEIGAYYIPWLDNLLDTIASPAAVVAGTIVSAALIADMDPFLRWTLAAIAGGGVAGVVQGSTVVTRAASTSATGGLANPLVATAELGGSVATSFLGLFAPLLALVLLAAVVAGLGLWWSRRQPVVAAR